ncbi:MAG TPA: hypothetical protein VKN18_11280 [Blastocatellia bacterium]|nr:hypothetical protein [Blastocatellia bacterium]
MSLFSLSVMMAATSFALVLLGGGLYEFPVVDPFWPKRPDLIQPHRGGISRRRFWIPAHALFELVLIFSLVRAWSVPAVRFWLLIALASHGAMRVWSAFDFIPKALAFERAETISEAAATAWSRRSKLRFPLDVITCLSLLIALSTALRG